jgi:Smg protein
MKQTVLDVLMYLFDSQLDDDRDTDPGEDSIRAGLLEAGFEERQVSRALEWLEGLARLREQGSPGGIPAGTATRVFSTEEMERLDADGRGFLLFLEQAEVLAPDERELVMDRVMALHQDEIDVEQLKWIVLMVLLNLPGRESSATWMEELVMDDAHALLH